MDGDTEGLCDGDTEAETLGLILGDLEALGLTEDEGLWLGDTEALGL